VFFVLAFGVHRFTVRDASCHYYLKTNQDRFVAELGEYLRFASVSRSPAQTRFGACAVWLVGIAADWLTAKCGDGGHPIVWPKRPARPDLRSRISWFMGITMCNRGTAACGRPAV